MSNLQLFAGCVAIWGSTWIAITFQLGAVAVEASVAYRFLIGSAIAFAYCRIRGVPVLFSAAQHRWVAFQGVLMFSLSYVAVYYAEQYIVSGLVAVAYSVSPLLNLVMLRVIFGTPVSGKIALGGLLGVVGIVLVFWPEFARLEEGGDPALGAFLAMLSVFISAAGSMAAHRSHVLQLPLWPTMAWGMLYGSLLTFSYALLMGRPLGFEPSLAYVASLLYLAGAGSILAFGAYLTLLGRIGAARAGYVGVMVPIVALAVSWAFEGYEWTWLAAAGVAVSVVGNVVILRRG